MKRILTIATAILLASAGSVWARETVKASDSRITFVGRTAVSEGAVSFDWSGVYAHIAFEGTRLEMQCSDTRANYFNVWIDKQMLPRHDFVVKTEGTKTIVLAEKLKKGLHEVTIQKRSEGEQGTVSIESFSTDGAFAAASPRKARHIEFIGDSYSCGYGTESAGRDEPFRAEEENCNLSYDCIIGRYFDADVSLVCHSGLGIVRNYDDDKTYSTMTVKYSQTFDQHSEAQWDPADGGYTPDIVVVYLGTNDFSTSRQPSFALWSSNYCTLLGKVRAFYGNDVPILCVASNADPLMGEYVEWAVASSGIKNVSWTSILSGAHNLTTDLGASWHPNYNGMRKVAACIIPYIATLTGWDMPLKAIE